MTVAGNSVLPPFRPTFILVSIIVSETPKKQVKGLLLRDDVEGIFLHHKPELAAKDLSSTLGRTITAQELASFLRFNARTARKYASWWGGVEVAPGTWRFFENRIMEVFNAQLINKHRKDCWRADITVKGLTRQKLMADASRKNGNLENDWLPMMPELKDRLWRWQQERINLKSIDTEHLFICLDRTAFCEDYMANRLPLTSIS